MRIIKATLSILSVSLLLLACGKEGQQTVINKGDTGGSTKPAGPNVLPTTIKVGTYNVWEVNNGNKYSGYEWAVRKARLAQSVANNAFDIFGIQECDKTIKESLPAAVREKSGKYIYEWHINKDSKIGFAYNKERLEVTEPKVFWLSDTPDKESNSWDGYPERLCLYTVVTDKLTDVKFGFMVTHGSLKDKPNAGDNHSSKVAKLVNERAETYSEGKLPVVFVGDLNMAPTDQGYKDLCEYWTDSYTVAPSEFVYGPVGSMNSHKLNTNLNDVSRRIDYVLLRDPNKQIEVVSYKCDNSSFDGYYPSDHCPVAVQLNIK